MHFKNILWLPLLTLLSCHPQPQQTAVINIRGSDTMLKLTENLANEFMKLNPGISIYVSGGGTSVGVRALIRGEVDITTASRNLKPEEAKQLAEYYGSLGMFFLVAKDALLIYLNPDNPIKNLTLDQLKKIYLCNITNWKEMGGEDQPIIPVSRNLNSGTYFYFQEHVLGGVDYCNKIIILPTTQSIIDFVAENKNSIGYGGFKTSDDIVYAEVDGIEPSDKNAQNDTYPITRYLHFFTTREPKGAVKFFIDWVLSPEGQNIVKNSGFIPLWELPF